MEKKKLTAGKIILRVLLSIISVIVVICLIGAGFVMLGKKQNVDRAAQRHLAGVRRGRHL